MRRQAGGIVLVRLLLAWRMQVPRTLALLLLILVSLCTCGTEGQRTCVGRSLRKKELQNETAICSDYTRAIYYLDPSEQGERWMIFLEGGGVCSSITECKNKYATQMYRMSHDKTVYRDTLCGTDVFDESDPENPFRHFRRVMLPYCTQDLYIGGNLGTKTRETFDKSIAKDVMDSKTDPGFAYAGNYVFMSLIQELKSLGLSNATEIVLAGTSAGALGIMNHVRWVQEQFPMATIRLLVDSGWIIDYKSIAARTLFTEYAQSNSALSDRPACRVIYNGLPCCISPVCMLYNTQVGVPESIPMLIVTSTFDLFMLQRALAAVRAPNRGLYVNLIADYGGAVNQTLNTARARRHTSIIQTQCGQHTYLVSTTLWATTEFRRAADRSINLLGQFQYTHIIESSVWSRFALDNGAAQRPSLRDLIRSWYNLTLENRTMTVSDRCQGFLCNSRCVDTLELMESSSSLSTGLQIFALVFAILLSVGAFLIKIGLKIHISRIHHSLKKFLNNPDTSEKLSDCLPESADVSVACRNLTYELTIPVKAKVDDEEDLLEGTTEYSKIHNNGEMFVDTPLPANNGRIRRSISDPGDGQRVTHKKKPLRTYSLRSSHEQRQEAKVPTTQVKVIINGVTAYFNSGSMVAVMGPSGCGKTTLMDLLTGRRAGDVSGEVLVNGHPLESVHSWYHRNTGYVRQLATPYYDQLTVRENLLYSALLRLPSTHTRSELFEQMKMVIQEVGLSEIEERVVGGTTGGGISGGEKKRLCVAMQLMSMPNIVFLDEPTSGLDSTAAKELLNVLHIISQGNRLVVVSIHQPRPEIYHLFARILFLCKGRVAFYGPPSKAVGFFMQAVQDRNPESFEKLASDPEKSNPADLILDALNDERNQECILEHYDDSAEPKRILQAVKKAKKQAGKSSVFGIPHGRSLWSALLALDGRMARQSWGQAIYLPLVFFFYGLGVGIAYYQANRGFLLLAAFNLLTNISFLFVSPALTSILLGRCLHIFEMEHGDGVMRVSHLVLHAFIHMTAITLIPFIMLTALIFYMVSMVGTFTDFLLILLVNLTANGTDVAIVILICVAVPEYATPIAHVVCAYVTFFEGFLYPLPDIHTAIRWLIYGNPNYYAFSAEMKILLDGRSLPCDQGSILQCTQENGNAILTQFGFDDADVYQSMLIMMGMTVFYLILAMIMLLPKGYVKTYFSVRIHYWFSSSAKQPDDSELAISSDPNEDDANDDDDEEAPLIGSGGVADPDEHRVNIVQGPLLHTSSVWTTMKRQATQHNMNRGPGAVIVPMAEEIRPRARTTSGGGKGTLMRPKSTIAISTVGSGEARVGPKQGTWDSLLHRRASKHNNAMQTILAEERARPYAMKWRMKTQAKNGGDQDVSGSIATRLMVSSVINWSRTVQEKQLESRREQSKRQISGHRKLMEDSLQGLLSQVRQQTDGGTGKSPGWEAARNNWRRATKTAKRERLNSAEQEDGGDVPDSSRPEQQQQQQQDEGEKKPRHSSLDRGKKKVQIAELPHILEESASASPTDVQSLDRSPRPRSTPTSPLSPVTPSGAFSHSPPALQSAMRTSAASSGVSSQGSPAGMLSRQPSDTASASGASSLPSHSPPLSRSASQSSVPTSPTSQSSSLSETPNPSSRLPIPLLSEEPGKHRRISYHQMVLEGHPSSRTKRADMHETAC
eukprot:scpid6940/ scgid11163/ ATP-binding cassette sub-family G member 2